MHWAISYYQTPHDNRAMTARYPALSQVVQMTPFLGGSALQVLLTNAFGKADLCFDRLLVADNPAFTNAQAATFAGQTAFQIPAGQSLGSDPLDLPVTAGRPLYFLMQTGRAQEYVDLASTSDVSLVNAALSPTAAGCPPLGQNWHQRKSWYCLAGFRVLRQAPSQLVELAGDSLMETGMVAASIGRHLLHNYPDQVAMINTSICGSQLLADANQDRPLLATFGPSLLHRMATSPWRPRVVVASCGGNDLMVPQISSQPAASLAQIQAGFNRLNELVQSRGGQLIVPSLGPDRPAGAAYGAGEPAVVAKWQALSAWMVQQPWAVNIDQVLCAGDGKLDPDCDFGDHLHLSPQGGDRLAAALTPKLDAALRSEEA